MLRRLLPCIGVACSLFALADARPFTKKDVHFLSLPTKLAKDHSGRGGDPADKYFRMSPCPICFEMALLTPFT